MEQSQSNVISSAIAMIGITRRLVSTILLGLLLTAAIAAQDRRAGALRPGQMAPDFRLTPRDGGAPVVLSSFRGKQPVALVFGSYT